jgi:hypothetical protein
VLQGLVALGPPVQCRSPGAGPLRLVGVLDRLGLGEPLVLGRPGGVVLGDAGVRGLLVLVLPAGLVVLLGSGSQPENRPSSSSESWYSSRMIEDALV